MPNNPPPDYDNIELCLWQRNLKGVRSRLNDRDRSIIKKIKTYASRSRYSEADIEKHIYQDEMFAAWFAKEPRRTSFHEKVAACWLHKELKTKIERLKSSGPKALYINTDGKIVTGEQYKKEKPSKSLDFRWKIYDKIFYAMHKYTKEGGGNQDSQFREMTQILQNFQKADDQNIILIVIVDGEYYNEKKMDGLNHYARTIIPCSYAVKIEDVPEIVKKYYTE